MRKEAFDFDISAYPDMSGFKGVLVLGTDTEVGKTMISGAIVRSIRKAGKTVDVFKPVASGCKQTLAGLVGEDAQFLAAAADTPRPLSEVIPIQLKPALAPNVAAERSGKTIDLNKIFAAYENLRGGADAVVVEGVGGLLCPITDEFWVIHMAKLFNLPVVVVARPNLGTINHTLLTVDTLRRHDVDVLGVIINRFRNDPIAQDPNATDDAVIAMQTNPQQIAERGDVKILAIVPDDEESSVPEARIGKDTQYAIDTVDWARLLKL